MEKKTVYIVMESYYENGLREEVVEDKSHKQSIYKNRYDAEKEA